MEAGFGRGHANHEGFFDEPAPVSLAKPANST